MSVIAPVLSTAEFSGWEASFSKIIILHVHPRAFI